MLGSLRGNVIDRLDNKILIEVANIGYWVQTGSWQPSGEVLCYLHHHIREDTSDLYGFETTQTLKLFELLISISGVGPKVGLALLSVGPSDRLIQAIENDDINFISLAPGVGKKVAQKICLELKNKLKSFSPSSELPHSQMMETEDLFMALEALGYKRNEIIPLIVDIPSGLSIDEQIKWVLKQYL